MGAHALTRPFSRSFVAGLTFLLAATSAGAGSAPDPARQAQLAHWLRDDCGACHGMTLKGGLGTPLTAEALAGKPPEGLAQTILRGRPGTAMPPWAPFLTESEATWLIERLMAGTPPAVAPAPE